MILRTAAALSVLLLVCIFSPPATAQGLRELEIQLAQNRARLEYLNKQIEKIQLARRTVSSQEEISQLDAQLAAAEANLELVESESQQLQSLIERQMQQRQQQLEQLRERDWQLREIELQRLRNSVQQPIGRGQPDSATRQRHLLAAMEHLEQAGGMDLAIAQIRRQLENEREFDGFRNPQNAANSTDTQLQQLLLDLNQQLRLMNERIERLENVDRNSRQSPPRGEIWFKDRRNFENNDAHQNLQPPIRFEDFKPTDPPRNNRDENRDDNSH